MDHTIWRSPAPAGEGALSTDLCRIHFSLCERCFSKVRVYGVCHDASGRDARVVLWTSRLGTECALGDAGRMGPCQF